MKTSVLAGVLLGLAVWLAACSGDDSEAKAEPRAALEIVVVTGREESARFELDCAPTSGNTPDPAAACAAIEENPEMLAPPEMTATCVGSEGVPPDVTIKGTANGKQLNFSVRSCDAPAARAESARLWLRAVGLGDS
jgi:hypothetical protein